MKSKKIDKRKTLAYAVAFYFTDGFRQVHDGKYDV